MPRSKSGLVPTPFARVLTDFMARQRPIWTTGRIAHAVKMRRSTIANWLYHDTTPPLEKMLEVMARLRIPMSELLAAYRDAGVPTPTLDFEEPATTTHTSGASDPRLAGGQTLQEKLAVTREILSRTGFPPAALEAMLSSIEASEQGDPSPSQRRIAEEHDPTALRSTPAALPDRTADRTPQRTQQGGAGMTLGTRYRKVIPREPEPDEPGESEASGAGGESSPSSEQRTGRSKKPSAT